jgi:hypothetical protein
LYPGDANGSMKSLVYGGDAGSAACDLGKLVTWKVAGKIILCDNRRVSAAVKSLTGYQAGGFSCQDPVLRHVDRKHDAVLPESRVVLGARAV